MRQDVPHCELRATPYPEVSSFSNPPLIRRGANGDRARQSMRGVPLGYSPDDMVLRHQYGVALSGTAKTEAAIAEFTSIVEQEGKRVPIRATLLFALKTRITNLEAEVEYARRLPAPSGVRMGSGLGWLEL